MVLKYDLSKVTEILRSKRGEKDYGCEKPWEPDNEFNRLERKQIAYHNFLRFFDENAEAIAAASNAPPSLSISPADAMDTSTYNIANERNIPNDPPVLSNNHQSSSPPHRPIPESQSQADNNLMSQEIQKGLVIDSNNVMTKDASDLLFVAFGARDLHQYPLVEHELRIVPYLVLDDEKFISTKAAKVIEKPLLEREDGSPLKDQEIRLLGELSYKAFKSQAQGTKLSLPSFPNYQRHEIVMVPQTKAARSFTPANVARRNRIHTAIAKRWMEHLGNDHRDALMARFILDSPEKARELIGKRCKYLYQMSVVETLGWQTFCKFTDNQIIKSGRYLGHMLDGLRIPCSKDEMNAFKQRTISTKYSTLQQTKVTLTKKISTKSKKRSVIRSVQVVVSECRPLELAVVSVTDDLSAGNFVPSEKRFREFWKRSDLFIDSILIKISIDAGNGSTKGIICSVNTKDPQSQRNVRIFFEMNGAKDTAENMGKSAFRGDGFIKSDLEAIMQSL